MSDTIETLIKPKVNGQEGPGVAAASPPSRTGRHSMLFQKMKLDMGKERIKDTHGEDMLEFMMRTLRLTPADRDFVDRAVLLSSHRFLEDRLLSRLPPGSGSTEPVREVTWSHPDKRPRMIMHKLCAYYGLEHNVINGVHIRVQYDPNTFRQWDCSLAELVELFQLETSAAASASGPPPESNSPGQRRQSPSSGAPDSSEKAGRLLASLRLNNDTALYRLVKVDLSDPDTTNEDLYVLGTDEAQSPQLLLNANGRPFRRDADAAQAPTVAYVRRNGMPAKPRYSRPSPNYGELGAAASVTTAAPVSVLAPAPPPPAAVNMAAPLLPNMARLVMHGGGHQPVYQLGPTYNTGPPPNGFYAAGQFYMTPPGLAMLPYGMYCHPHQLAEPQGAVHQVLGPHYPMPVYPNGATNGYGS